MRSVAPAATTPSTTCRAGADLGVVGGGLDGVASALAADQLGRRVMLTETEPWLDGQLIVQEIGVGGPTPHPRLDS